MHPHFISRIGCFLLALVACTVLWTVAYRNSLKSDNAFDSTATLSRDRKSRAPLYDADENRGGETCPAIANFKRLQSFNLDNIHAYFPISNTNDTSPTDTVLILTPLMDAESYLDHYFSKLATISYPKELISLGFLVSTLPRTNSDATLQSLEKHTSTLAKHSDYRRITVIQQQAKSSQHYEERHQYDRQKLRRQSLARCRNMLVTTALLDESWVLWLDVDVVDYAPSLLLELMRIDKDIISPNCFRASDKWRSSKWEPYDRNNWIETTESLANQRVMDTDEILYEGYEREKPTYRLSMADMDAQKYETVPIDGVGGTFTLIKAVVHRSGVGFPSFPIDHQIETEGLAKWAKREGFSVYGAPQFFVRHA